MIEAVGEAFWPDYFQALHDYLRPGGTVVLQAITIDESRFESYHQSPGFIQRHIFPERFGESYARTLAEWRHRFVASRRTIEAIGFSQEFQRMWDYYLSYSEGGFRAGIIDVGLYVFRRSAA
jgi:cyclopropane-fatty-acyl-phospholipid synthase